MPVSSNLREIITATVIFQSAKLISKWLGINRIKIAASLYLIPYLVFYFYFILSLRACLGLAVGKICKITKSFFESSNKIKSLIINTYLLPWDPLVSISRHTFGTFYSLKLLCSFVLVCSVDLLCIVSTSHNRTRWPCVFSGSEWYIVLQILCWFLNCINKKKCQITTSGLNKWKNWISGAYYLQCCHQMLVSWLWRIEHC